MKSVKKHRSIKKHLERLRGVRRRKHHPLIHEIHRKYGLSRKTLLYVKEYGPHTNVPKTIIKESLKVLLFASVLSSFGGLALEYVKTAFVSIVPLIILLPALNGMIGNYGIIISSRFSTLLHMERVKGKLYKQAGLRHLFAQVLIVALFTAFVSSFIALIVSFFSGYSLDAAICYKIFLVVITDIALLVCVLFLIAVFAGLYFYRNGEDPDNFLIPITTSFADFGNMVFLAVLVKLFF